MEYIALEYILTAEYNHYIDVVQYYISKVLIPTYTLSKRCIFMETFERLLQLMIVCTKIVTKKKDIAFAITLSKSLNKPGKKWLSMSFFSVADVT